MPIGPVIAVDRALNAYFMIMIMIVMQLGSEGMYSSCLVARKLLCDPL